MKDTMWELCPKCNGTGTMNGMYNSIFQTCYCDVCQGSKLISKLNGKPAHRVTTSTNYNTEINKPWKP